MGSIVPNPPGGFQHPALVYDGLDDFLRPVTSFVREGLESGEPVFAAVGPAELGALIRVERERYGNLIREANIKAN